MTDWPHSLKVGPIGDWPGALTSQRQVSKFSASLTHTLRTLDREIWNLVDTKAQQDSAELLIAIPPGAFRLDGRPYTQGRSYCGRSSAKRATSWAAVTCEDCKSARRADEEARA